MLRQLRSAETYSATMQQNAAYEAQAFRVAYAEQFNVHDEFRVFQAHANFELHEYQNHVFRQAESIREVEAQHERIGRLGRLEMQDAKTEQEQLLNEGRNLLRRHDELRHSHALTEQYLRNEELEAKQSARSDSKTTNVSAIFKPNMMRNQTSSVRQQTNSTEGTEYSPDKTVKSPTWRMKFASRNSKTTR
jgi:hypothetical protein